MKKLVSLLLAVCMCLSVSVMLTACGHEHTYQTEWSKDTTHHWHACEGQDCADVADKAEHTWNEGEITTEATAEADGVKTFTCTVCGQAKTEDIKYAIDTEVTENEFLAALDGTYFDNVSFELYEIINGSGDQMTVYLDGDYYFSPSEQEFSEKISEDEIKHYEYSSGEWVAQDRNYYATELLESRTNVIDEDFREPLMRSFASFEYDTQNAKYVGDVELWDDLVATITLWFENNKLLRLELMCQDGGNDICMKYHFFDYGSTKIEKPEVSENSVYTVTEEEWETAFDFDCSFLQAKIFEADLSGEAEFINTEDGIRYVETYGYTLWYACYMEKVDNGWFVYEGETESGSSIEDIKSYSKEFYTFEEAAMYLFTEDAYKVYTAPFADCYEEFRYDEESQSYVADSIVLTNYHYDEKLGYADAEFSEVSISFANNRISQVCYTQILTYSNGETEEDAIRVEFSYDEVEIVFPVVTE